MNLERIIDGLIKETLNLINEINTEDAYTKFYKGAYDKVNLEKDREFFKRIIKLDPTYNEEKDKMGLYTKWLYRKDNFQILKKMKDEDLYKVYDDLKTFDNAKNKNLIPQENKDINKFNIITLSDFIFELKKDPDNLLSNADKEREIKKDIEKYELDDWTIIVPKTEEASCYYGKGTRWCTASTEYGNQFNSHNEKGPLYILINKHDPSEKYQFHFETSQFMDVMDRRIDLFNFMEENGEIYDFFDNLDEVDIDYNMVLNGVETGNVYDVFSYYYSHNFTDDQKFDILTKGFEVYNEDGIIQTTIDVLHYVNYPDLLDHFKSDILYVLDAAFGDSYVDIEDIYFLIDLLGGFNKDTIDNIMDQVDLEDMNEYEKLWKVAKHFENEKFLLGHLNKLDFDMSMEYELKKLKKKFEFDEEEKTFKSKVSNLKILGYDYETNNVEVVIIPKDNEGNLLENKKKKGFIHYKNIYKYLTMPQIFNENKIKKLLKQQILEFIKNN